VFLKLLKRFFAFDFEFFYTFVFQALEDTVPLPVSIVRPAVEDHALAIIVRGLIISDFIGVPTNLVVQVRHAPLPVIVVLVSRLLARVVGVLYADLLTQGNHRTLKRRDASAKIFRLLPIGLKLDLFVFLK